MPKHTIGFIQVNLQHCKAASDILSKTFTCSNINIALIQEPYVYGGQIRRLSSKEGRLVYCKDPEPPRAAVLVKTSVHFSPIPCFTSRDLVAIEAEIPTASGVQAVILASAYFPGDVDQMPPVPVQQLVQYCKTRRKNFIIGCDANAHHTVWGSNDINKRGECLYDYLASSNIDIMNRGKEPTFVTRARTEVLDITLTSSILAANIKKIGMYLKNLPCLTTDILGSI